MSSSFKVEGNRIKLNINTIQKIQYLLLEYAYNTPVTISKSNLEGSSDYVIKHPISFNTELFACEDNRIICNNDYKYGRRYFETVEDIIVIRIPFSLKFSKVILNITLLNHIPCTLNINPITDKIMMSNVVINKMDCQEYNDYHKNWSAEHICDCVQRNHLI